MFQSFRSASTLAISAAISASSLACVDISAGNVRYIDTVEKRFTVSGEPTVTLGTFDGSVEVGTWDRPEVLVVVEKHAVDKESADRIVVDTAQDGDRIKVDVTHGSDHGGFSINIGSFSAQVKVTVPSKAHIEASTGDGRVTVRDVEGNLTVRTGDGSIRLSNVHGAVDANTGDGSVDVDGVIARLKVRSGDGRVRVHPTAPPASDWSVDTGDGTVVLEVPDRFDAELYAATGDGRVRVSGVDFVSDGDDSRHRTEARGRLGQGGARITLRSGDGTITVRRADGAFDQ
ncbi:MAG: DUF4097 family beta strand repeat-containing protein [Vicinamibacterales bacterium]